MDKITVVPEKALHGTVWDVKGLGQVAGIYVHYETNKVFALQFLFYEKNNLVKSKRHGQITIGTANFSAIVFDYPSEFLTEISGSHEIIIIDQPIFIRASSILTCIKFGTNRGSYGPFGDSTTTSINSKLFNFQFGNQCLFGGFHGTKTKYCIESIGVYVKTNLKVAKDKEDD